MWFVAFGWVCFRSLRFHVPTCLIISLWMHMSHLQKHVQIHTSVSSGVVPGAYVDLPADAERSHVPDEGDYQTHGHVANLSIHIHMYIQIYTACAYIATCVAKRIQIHIHTHGFVY